VEALKKPQDSVKSIQEFGRILFGRLMSAKLNSATLGGNKNAQISFFPL
jgi:hypothetical protein